MGPEDAAFHSQGWVTVDDLVELARRLQRAGVQFVVYGGIACVLHGFVRATNDLDLCIGENPDNIKKALNVLASWGQGFARELKPDDVLDSVVVRIGDAFTLDIASKIWKLDWEQAWARRRIVTIDGVDIPVLSREHLIKSKLTYREKDAWDVRELSNLIHPEPGRPAEGDV